MTFDEVLEQAIDMLQRRERVSYGALKRQFALDDEYLVNLKSELIEVFAVAATFTLFRLAKSFFVY